MKKRSVSIGAQRALHPHHYFLSNSLKFLQKNHLEEKSCHTFRTQSADQALIIIIDVCQNTQLKHLAHSLGNPFHSAQRRLLSMQNVWVMYLRLHGVTHQGYSQ